MTNSYPQTLQAAILYFADPDRALEYVAAKRWSNGTTCPHCGSKDAYFLRTRRIWKCKDCRKQFSIKTGTIFEDSPIGLDKWLCAVWMIANDKNGISRLSAAPGGHDALCYQPEFGSDRQDVGPL